MAVLIAGVMVETFGCATYPKGRMWVDPAFASHAEVVAVKGRPNWQGIVGMWPLKAEMRIGVYRVVSLSRSAEAGYANAATMFNGNRATSGTKQTFAFGIDSGQPSWKCQCTSESWRQVQYHQRLDIHTDGAELSSEAGYVRRSRTLNCELRDPANATATVLMTADPGSLQAGSLVFGQEHWSIRPETRTEGQDRWHRTQGGWVVYNAAGVELAAIDAVGPGLVVLGGSTDAATRELLVSLATALLVVEQPD